MKINQTSLSGTEVITKEVVNLAAIESESRSPRASSSYQIMSVDPPSSSNKQQVCPYFAKRQCKRGRLCQFLHIIEIDREKAGHEDADVKFSDLAEFQKSTDVLVDLASCSSTKPTQSSDSGISKIPCRHYFQRGWCAYGEQCRFSHVDPSCAGTHIPRQKSSNARRSHWNDDVSATQIIDAIKSEEENATGPTSGVNKRLCRYYKHGSCFKGKRCQFRHPATDGKSGESEEGQPSAAASVEPNGDNAKEGSQSCGSREVNLQTLRKTELEQLRKRFPKATETTAVDGVTVFQFVFTPTDPDWVIIAMKSNFFCV